MVDGQGLYLPRVYRDSPASWIGLVAIPAAFAGFVFQAGLVIHGFRTIVVRMNGLPTSSLMVLSRALLSALPGCGLAWLLLAQQLGLDFTGVASHHLRLHRSGDWLRDLAQYFRNAKSRRSDAGYRDCAAVDHRSTGRQRCQPVAKGRLRLNVVSHVIAIKRKETTGWH